jgi:opacity protein-like surface antigen
MKALIVSCLFASTLACAAAQAQNSGAGWEFGADVIYSDGTDVSFEGGSRVEFDEDWGIALTFGYRFNEHLDLTFALDWQEMSYDADFVSSTIPGLAVGVSGDMEAFVPQVGLNYNFGTGAVQPYVSGEIGWAFVDTNIPNSRVQIGCWWDPWWGQICTPYQSTKSIDDFVYGLGVGVRWNFTPGYVLRFAYEKRWWDYSKSTSTPDFDMLRLGISFQY